MPKREYTGTSLTSLQEAIDAAFAGVPENPEKEGLATAQVQHIWLEKGGVVDSVQYHVTLRADTSD